MTVMALYRKSHLVFFNSSLSLYFKELYFVNDNKKASFRQGIMVFVALAILTVIEVVIAAYLDDPAVPLVIIALVKAGLIVQYFMHIYRLWREESH
jgi:heme/copper-type cytochrome/quinol oxidase subunit 4